MEQGEGARAFECMGARIVYRRKGSGPPLLYLRSEESLPGDARFIDALAASFELIIPDHPGFGQSDNPDWFRAMGDVAYFYLDFLEHLGIGSTHVVGASTGGWIAAEIAARDSSRLASMTLLAPFGVRQPGSSFGDIFLWTPEQNIRNRFFDAGLAEGFLHEAPTKETTTALLKDRYATARIGWSPRFHNPELQRWLHRIAPPVLLLWGEEDKVAPVQMANAWLAGLPDARLVAIPRCGHLPHMEAVEATVSEISGFIGGVPAQAASGREARS